MKPRFQADNDLRSAIRTGVLRREPAIDFQSACAARFRDLDERWRSASTGRRTACPTYFAKRLIQQGGAGGFACRSNSHNQWSASKLNKFPKTVMHPADPAEGQNDIPPPWRDTIRQCVA